MLCTLYQAIQPGILHLVKLVLDVVAISIEVTLLSFVLQVKWLKSYASFIEGLGAVTHGDGRHYRSSQGRGRKVDEGES